MNKNLLQLPVMKSALKTNLYVNKAFNSFKNEHLSHRRLDGKFARIHTTIDKEDIKRHTQLAKEWWDPNGPMKALHSYNLLRVPFVRDGLVPCSASDRTALPLLNKSILDVGCGGGILSEALARLGANVTGIDASPELIELAQEHSTSNPKITSNKPKYTCTSIEKHSLSFKDYYDGVVASEVIEHVNNKEFFVKCCIQTVKPGGKIFITTPNRTRLSQILGIYVSEYILNIVPKGTHEYEKFTTPNELTFLLERNNCHVQAVYGIMYYPFVNKWDWINSPSLIFALQAVKCKEQQQ